MAVPTENRGGTVWPTEAPTGCRRVLALGYEDGPIDGVLETHSGDVYRFDFVAKVHTPNGLDRRTYIFRPLPAESLDRLTAVLAPFIPPIRPDWLPIWRFPNDATREAVEFQVDSILDEAGPDQWEVVSDPLSSLKPFAEVRPVMNPAVRT